MSLVDLGGFLASENEHTAQLTVLAKKQFENVSGCE